MQNSLHRQGLRKHQQTAGLMVPEQRRRGPGDGEKSNSYFTIFGVNTVSGRTDGPFLEVPTLMLPFHGLTWPSGIRSGFIGTQFRSFAVG